MFLEIKLHCFVLLTESVALMKIIFKGMVTFIVVLAFALNICWAEEKKETKPQSIEYLSGFGLAKLKKEGNYHIVPFYVAFDYDLKPFSKKMGMNLPGLFQFGVEPFASFVFDPHNNAEIGTNFAVKMGILNEAKAFQPYIKGGVGFVYLTEHVSEQSTQFNFTEYAGLGTHYFFTKNTAFTIEYRFRHISNADIKRPNTGIGTNIWLCGIYYSF